MRIHGSLAYGRLASFYVLDTRQYRSHQVCARPNRGGGNVVTDETCPARLDHALTMLGASRSSGCTRARALGDALERIAQQTYLSPVESPGGTGHGVWTEGWDGKIRARANGARIDPRASNPVIVTARAHARRSPTSTRLRRPQVTRHRVGIWCPAITSQGPSMKTVFGTLLQEIPHQVCERLTQGLPTVEITPERCIARHRTIASVTETIRRCEQWSPTTAEAGKPGVEKA